jgi:Caspase domain
MESRGLIIAIQDYSQSQGLFSQTLEGTHDSAGRFYQWLTSEKLIKPECIFLCSDGKVADGHPATTANRTGQEDAVRLERGASRQEIIAALLDLIDLGQDDTNEMFVFFSGHGFGYQQSPWRLGLDVLVGSDFRSFRDGGGACIKLDELRVRLCTCLGGKDHYFFIDACRNVVNDSQIQALGLGISPSTAQLGFPTIYTLYSVKYGEPAPVNPDFPKALMQGLAGQGHAKGWVQGQMYVKFDLLCDYIEDKVLPRQIDSKREGNGKGTLLQLPAPVLSACDIVVVDAPPEREFQLQITSGSAPVQSANFTGTRFTTTLEPNDRTYQVEVFDAGLKLELFDPPPKTPIDMYSPCTLKFRHRTGDVPGPDDSPMGHVELIFKLDQAVPSSAPAWNIQLRNLRSGELVEHPAGISTDLSPGKYAATIKEDGATALTKMIRVSAGKKIKVDLLARKSTPFQKAFLERTLSLPHARVADFSETLGPTANWNPQLWLAYLGAAHILRDPGMYHKLSKIPLISLGDLLEEESAVFVLSAVEGDTPRVALSKGSNVDWSKMEPVDGIPSLCQARLSISDPSALFSIKVGNLVPLSYAICALPGRVTLFNISQDGENPLTVQQFMLVPSHLQRRLPPDLQWRFFSASATPLKVVQFMSLAQQRFAERKSVAPVEPTEPGVQSSLSRTFEIWRSLLDAKWIDPILGIVALYDIVRQGAQKQSPYRVESVLANLQHYFPDIPDVAVLHRLLLNSILPVKGAPLFLEGALALAAPDAKNVMTLSSDRLDFNSIWTCWRDAVQQQNKETPAVQLRTR